MLFRSEITVGESNGSQAELTKGQLAESAEVVIGQFAGAEARNGGGGSGRPQGGGGGRRNGE